MNYVHGMIEIKVVISHASLLLGSKSVALMYTHVHISVSICIHVCVGLP